MKESHTRSVLKGVSWRIFATLDTIIISYFITGKIGAALGIGFAEVITKVFIYYLHERVWQRFPPKTGKASRRRSLLKAMSWRAVGTMDTILLSFIITGHVGWAFSIGAVELVTKIVLYYLHERVWVMIPFGKIAIEDEPPTGSSGENLGHQENATAYKQ